MSKLRAAFFEIEEWEIPLLKERLKEFELSFNEEKLSPSHYKEIADVEVLCPLIYSTIDAEVLKHLPKLRFVATRSTGFDHIDLSACKARNVAVANVPTYGENTVAEHTFALILALARKIAPSIERTRRGNFSLEGLRGFDLQGKTLGVVGVGHIGRHVIRIAKGFGMEVVAYDLHRNDQAAQEMGFNYAPLEEVLGRADIVTLHVPYTQATHHLIKTDTLKLFKKGAYLINTARGAVCDTTALLQGLEQGIFAGLALDVLEEECELKEERELLTKAFTQKCDLVTVLENHILLTNPKVLITPHNAFNSTEALERILEVTIDNIGAFARGKPINLVQSSK